MLAKVCSAAVNGIEAYPVEVEVNAGFGDTLIVIVGLPDAAVKESRASVSPHFLHSAARSTYSLRTPIPHRVAACVPRLSYPWGSARVSPALCPGALNVPEHALRSAPQFRSTPFPMLAKVCSAAVNGIDAYPVEVEVNAGYGDTIDRHRGLPGCRRQGIPRPRDDRADQLRLQLPLGRTTINLAPADVKKEGPSFDLPIAIGMVAASEQMETDQLDNFVMVGELALTAPCARSKACCPSRCAAHRRKARSACWCPPRTPPRPPW
jgi:hypothetical protein